MAEYDYFMINKPFGMLSQFTKEGKRAVLGEMYNFPKDVYPVGRLDADSEGLLLLTNDKRLNQMLLNPEKQTLKTYLVQVDGAISEMAIEQLRMGVEIKVKKQRYKTKPAVVNQVDTPEWLKPRVPPVRFRANIPTSWLSIKISEGKNRQIRRMTASVGFPTLRLIRTGIGSFQMNSWAPPVQKLDASVIHTF